MIMISIITSSSSGIAAALNELNAALQGLSHLLDMSPARRILGSQLLHRSPCGALAAESLASEEASRQAILPAERRAR
jgi:hypothetical protein